MYQYLSHFSTITYIVGTHQQYLPKALLMNAHYKYFRGEERKYLDTYAYPGAVILPGASME